MSPTQFPLLYTKCALWHRVLVNRNLLGLECVHPEQKYLERFANFNKALPSMLAVLAWDLWWDLVILKLRAM